MGFQQQPNTWQCGPYALKHALLLLGVHADLDTISKVARSRKNYGTDDNQLRRAASKYRCDFPMVRKLDPERAKREMVEWLQEGYPCLLCIDEWAHWVTVAKWERGNFIVLDSEAKGVFTVLTWKQLKSRWVFHEEDEYDEEAVHTFFDFHPVVPRFRVRVRPNLSLARVRKLRYKKNRDLALLWEDYVQDLQDFCKVRDPRATRFLSLGEFLRRNEGIILDEIEHWHGQVERKPVARILEHFRFVADTLGMVIPRQDEKRAIAGITCLLTLWSAGKFGVRPFYVPPKQKRGQRGR